VRVVGHTRARRNLRRRASCYAIEENTGLIEEVKTLDNVTVGDAVWVRNVVFILFAHRARESEITRSVGTSSP